MEHTFLFILRDETIELREKAYKAIRKVGNRVPALYDCSAIEIIATTETAKHIFDLGFFLAYSDHEFAKDQVEQFSKTQQVIVNIWNLRFSPEFKKMKADQPSQNVRWGAKGFREPAPYTIYDTGKFKEKLTHIVKNKNKSKEKTKKSTLFSHPHLPKISTKQFRPTDIATLESSFMLALKDKELAYHAARLWYHLTPLERETVAGLDHAQVLALFSLPESPLAPEGPSKSWRLHGEISVGIVIVESTLPGGPTFTAFEKGSILNQIFTGLNLLTSLHPSGNLTWVFNLQIIGIDAPNQDPRSKPVLWEEKYWLEPAMKLVNFQGQTFFHQSFETMMLYYRRALREANRSNHSQLFLITPYGTSDFAYTASQFVILSPSDNNWGGHGLGGVNLIVAHETCHIYNAVDEYSDNRTNGTVCSSCDTEHGADIVPNGNCEACAKPGQKCLMVGNQAYMCEYTKGHIGWSDLFVELFTADVNNAGTDDKVWLDIGDRTFVLDSDRIDDRERGNRQGYAVWVNGNLQPGDIKRILIRKNVDGSNGGWKLKRVKVYYQGQVLCDETPNVWLSHNHRWWIGCIRDNTIINSLQMKVTTANEDGAGTDDEVTLEMGGHTWQLDNKESDDFVRGATDSFNLDPQKGFYPEQITTITIKKAPDGESGRWKLRGIELIINGTSVYNNQNINTWISGNNLTWTTNI